MKLSEAIMLGSTTCKMVGGDWNSCALGCAGNAVGIPQGVTKSYDLGRSHFEISFLMDDSRLRRDHIRDAWPWLMDRAGQALKWESKIFLLFDEQVCSGRINLEQLVDYIRSIEPSCGDCNRFECTCAKSEATPEPVQEAVWQR